MKTIKTALGLLLSLGMVSPSFALGGAAIGNEVPSARMGGEGYVGTAGQNDDAVAAYVNPAALTSLKGTQVTVGATWENLHGDYQSDTGATTKMRSIDVGVPNFAVSQSFMDGKIGAGLSVLSPYGLETHWSGDSALRYIATNSVLHIVTISPAVAYQLCPNASVGVGAANYINAFDASLEKHINVQDLNSVLTRSPAASAEDANSRLTGTGANWGYHAGMTVQPNEKNSFGLVYHSKVKLNINGSLDITGLSGAAASPFAFGAPNYNTSAYTDIILPQNLQFGYAFKPDEKWTFEADSAWTDWYSARDLDVRYPAASPAAAAILTANSGNIESLDWRDAWSFATGANYKVTDALQVRSGFWYEPWASPESTFTPAFMDLSRYGLSIGAGYVLTSNLTLDVSYTAVFFHTRSINNDLLTAAGVQPGSYSNFANLVAFNVSYKFGAK